MSIIKHVTLQKIVARDFRYDPRTLETFDAIDYRCFILIQLLRTHYTCILFDNFCLCFFKPFIYAKHVTNVGKKFSLHNVCSGFDICFYVRMFPSKFKRYMC